MSQTKYVGMWVTADGYIRQELLPTERYDEAHLFLGKDAYATAEIKIAAVKRDMEAIRSVATSTDF